MQIDPDSPGILEEGFEKPVLLDGSPGKRAWRLARAGWHLWSSPGSPPSNAVATGGASVGSRLADDALGDLSARRAALASGRHPAGVDSRASLDVRGDGSVGSNFAAASEALGWLRSDSHQERLKRLRDKYGYE